MDDESAIIEGKYKIKKSSRQYKKYMVLVNNKWVHFGDDWYEQYKDSTPLQLYKHLDHNDAKWRRAYIARHTKRKDGDGKYFHKNKSSPEYWSLNYLW